MKCSSKIKINQAKIRELSKAAIVSLEETAEALHTEVAQAQVVPRDMGALQGEKFFVDYSESSSGKVSLVHEGPYARRLYFHPEYNFRKDENPNAKGKWLEDWCPGGKKENSAPGTFKKLYRRNAGL